MDFNEVLDLLAAWAGREVAAAVRITRDEGAPSVAVLRGRLGRPERDRQAGDSEVFFPIRLGTDLDGPTGLHLSPAKFQEALSERDQLYVRLDDAIVEVAPA